jgi:hypothetical protein
MICCNVPMASTMPRTSERPPVELVSRAVFDIAVRIIAAAWIWRAKIPPAGLEPGPLERAEYSGRLDDSGFR